MSPLVLLLCDLLWFWQLALLACCLVVCLQSMRAGGGLADDG